MGHAGAIISGEDDSAEAKFKVLQECGVTIARSPAELGQKVAEVLKK
jgi:succinyl-CoA synthetase alpha subunit